MATAPTDASLNKNVWSNSKAIAFKTLIACLVTSGPMPSPGKTAIFNFISNLFFRSHVKGNLLLYVFASPSGCAFLTLYLRRLKMSSAWK